MLTLTLSLIWWRFNTVVLPRRKESSRSLSHLLMSFLSHFIVDLYCVFYVRVHVTAVCSAFAGPVDILMFLTVFLFVYLCQQIILPSFT